MIFDVTAAKRLNEQLFQQYIPVIIGEDEAHGVRKKPNPDMVFAAIIREQQNLSRSVCRTQKSHFLHEPASLEPKNIMSGTPRIALLKKKEAAANMT